MSTNEQPRPSEVKIIWHGHSCFELKSEEATIVIDPYDHVTGYGTLDLAADMVLCSHDHGDHNATDRVRLSGRTPRVEVEVIDSFHDDAGGTKRGKNKIHIVTLGGKRIAHMGDLGHYLSDSQLERLQRISLVLIPVGGHYTIDADVAAKIIRQIKPDLTVPMHFREKGAGFDVLATVEPFLEQFERICRHSESSFNLGDFDDCVLVLKNPKQ